MSNCDDVAAGILPAVEGGILPPGSMLEDSIHLNIINPISPGRMPGSTAARMAATTNS